MQVYLSALVFIPGPSIIRREFSKFIPPWIKVVSPPRQAWNPELFILEGSTKSFLSLEFSPDNTVLASGAYSESVRLWDVATGIELQRLSLRNSICCIRFSKDGERLALGGLTGFIGL